jgi:N-acetylmuramoyl-L-alanine amidase
LEERENAADLVGGVSLDDKDDVLASVLLDLSMSGTIDVSTRVANNVLSELRRVGPVRKKVVQFARFVVLKSPDIPSMLIETAFISNPREERRLRSPSYQLKMARGILSVLKSISSRILHRGPISPKLGVNIEFAVVRPYPVLPIAIPSILAI